MRRPEGRWARRFSRLSRRVRPFAGPNSWLWSKIRRTASRWAACLAAGGALGGSATTAFFPDWTVPNFRTGSDERSLWRLRGPMALACPVSVLEVGGSSHAPRLLGRPLRPRSCRRALGHTPLCAWPPCTSPLAVPSPGEHHTTSAAAPAKAPTYEQRRQLTTSLDIAATGAISPARLSTPRQRE